ncbi:hypothetical protein LSH36_379g01036 [Paralvinella palmiformis]|uniref:Uncharacterized protein n=1 Tax=Paralvinella palmiformis TaxID=53620 RepID=A0AAD9JES3_9ANNE|nr:hypothetical protein LSH36_379g01036 [Paralvinella palmiformis]
MAPHVKVDVGRLPDSVLVGVLLIGVNWLDHSKTLREQGVDDKETLLLRRKFFFSDQNVDARDPVQLNLLYVQVRFKSISLIDEQVAYLIAAPCRQFAVGRGKTGSARTRQRRIGYGAEFNYFQEIRFCKRLLLADGHFSICHVHKWIRRAQLPYTAGHVVSVV